MAMVFQVMLKEPPPVSINITSSDWGFKDQLPERFLEKLARL